MTLIDRYAALVLSEQIARGEAFNVGMSVKVSGGRLVTVTAEIAQAATKTANERDEKGFEGER